MFVRIETTSGIPITRQIMDQVQAQCVSGSLRPGDRLPSVRQLARQLAVNQNTILRVYERLTAEGLLERRHGDGTYVVDTIPPAHMERQRQLLRDDAQRIAQKAMTLGLNANDIKALIDQAFTPAPGSQNAASVIKPRSVIALPADPPGIAPGIAPAPDGHSQEDQA